MDRPTHNSLVYLTSVQPHHIQRENFLVDEFVKQTLEDDFGYDVVQQFGEYTRSFYTLEGHYQNLWNYDRKIMPKPQDQRLERAIAQTYLDFKLDEPVTSISWNNLKSVPFIPSSSAGWGFTGKKGDPGNHDLAINKAVMSLKWWLDDKFFNQSTFRFHPDLAWTRTQLGTYDNPKIRTVCGTSFDNIILEGICAYPLINAYRIKRTPMAVGSNYYRTLPTMINQCLYDGTEHLYGVAIDLKSFDSSIQPWLIEEAFDILESNLHFNDAFGRWSFEYSKHFFIKRPIVMPDGRMWLKQLGIPSGSYYTQLIGSIVNMIATHYAQICVYDRTFPTYVLGDDSLFGVPCKFGLPSLDNFREHYHTLGITQHPDKGTIAIHPHDLDFLGHVARGAKVDRDSAELMRLALYPEHPVLGPAMSLNRVRGILLDSACNSWPIIHLHRMMTIKYRNDIDPKGKFLGSDKDWLVAVLNIQVPPANITEFTTLLLT